MGRGSRMFCDAAVQPPPPPSPPPTPYFAPQDETGHSSLGARKDLMPAFAGDLGDSMPASQIGGERSSSAGDPPNEGGGEEDARV